MSARLLAAIVLAGLGCAAAVPALASTRDPMRPPNYLSHRFGAPALPALHLQSIQYSARQRLAIIDGRPLREGASIGPWRVLSIHRGSVVVASGDTTRTLMLFPVARKRIMSNPPRAGE